MIDVINIVGIPSYDIGFIAVRNDKAKGDRLVNDEFIISEGAIIKLYSPRIGG